MGLAQALKKRKLGGNAATAEKRVCQQNGGGGSGSALSEDPAEALRRQLANGGFAALISSHQSKHTRTALRKQRKAEAAAKAAAKAAAQAAEADGQRRQQRRAAGEASDSEEEDSLAAGAAEGGAAARGAAAGEDEEQAAAAYTRLLGSLGSRGGAFADALQQRQREQAGDSDATSSEGEDDANDDDGEDEGDLGSDLQMSSREEGEEEAGSASGDSDEDDPGDGGSEEEEGVAGGGASGDENGRADSGSSDSDGEAEELEGARRRGLPANGAAAVSTVPSPASVEDHYLEHFDRELPEEQAAALLDGSSARTRYEDCVASGGSRGGEQGPAVAPDVLRQWPDASLQAAEGTRLPQSAPGDLAAYGVKERLLARWREVARASATGGAAGGAGDGQQGAAAAPGVAAGPDGDFASPQQRALFALLSCYADLLLPCRPYPTAADAPDLLLDAVLLHALSHCAKAADRIKRNNERLRAAGADGAAPLDAVPKDQGFTRAKVLLLLPQRNLALRCVSRLLALAVRETRSDTIQNKQRFLDEFGDQGEELTEREKAAVARKPPEHRALFGGNMDDHFRMGIKLTRGAVKLFADFYDSDIIVASPLALATKLAEGDEGAADFLSSVEVLLVERADVMLMQNWAHVVTVFEALNQIPKDGHGVDMMRVRDWALSGRGALYRQTVLLSSFASAEMNALLARTCRNAAGKARLRPSHHGVLSHVIPQARQVFERLPAAVAEGGAPPPSDADARFEHFKRVLWPRIKESGRSGGHLVYIPSYFDYVRVRNYLRQEMASFLGLCEYTERADAARARSYFFDRRKRVLLYTERAQFYNRHRIRGAQDILFYQLPEHAGFYAELLNLLEESGTGETPTVTVVFSKYDALRLERVVGSARSAKMLKQRKTGTFLFC